jgi:hypothetical protein
MSEAPRVVTSAGKNAEGDILWLCNSGRPWSPRAKAAALRDIKNGVEYRVNRADGPIVEVVRRPDGPHLKSRANSNPQDDLHNLPSCY